MVSQVLRSQPESRSDGYAANKSMPFSTALRTLATTIAEYPSLTLS